MNHAASVGGESAALARILVIDDDEALRQVVSAILQSAGYAVATAANGQEGLDQLAAGRFEVVLTDLIMPEKEGLETIREVRRRDATIKIIAMSGGGFGDSRTYLGLAEKLGAHLTLPKPFSGTELLACVAAVIGAPS
jgi:DNA-binding response OmpR family regulator